MQDSNGCAATAEATVEEPDALSVTGVITNDSGIGDGALDITVAVETVDTPLRSGPDNYTSADEDLTGIVAGEYTVTVTDANGCSVTETFGVPVELESTRSCNPSR